MRSPAWEDMPDDLKPVLARQMEVYAGFLEHTDHHIGRLVDALADLEVLDDTLIYYIVGDNGASAEGTPQGTFNEMISLNGAAGIETTEFLAERIDQFGTIAANNHYAVGWAHALDTPTSGPSRSPPTGAAHATARRALAERLRARGEVRAQFSHVIDIAATVLDAAGLPAPTFVHGVQQMPLHGKSMVSDLRRFHSTRAPRDAVLRDVRQPRHLPQGLDRGDPPQHPVDSRPRCPRYDDDVWELYAPDDWTQAHDLSAEQPDRLHELQRLFLIEAARYNVLPLDDRRFERFNSDIAGRPQLDPRTVAAAVRGHGPAVRELGPRHQEQVARRHSADRGARRRWRGSDRRPGRRLRRLEPVPPRGTPGLLLQLLRPPAVQGLRRQAGVRRRAPGADGVRLRRRRAGQGRRRDALSRRRQGRRGARRAHRGDGSSPPTRRPTSAGTARHPSATTTAPTTPSPAGSAGSRSTSTRQPKTWTT